MLLGGVDPGESVHVLSADEVSEKKVNDLLIDMCHLKTMID